MRYLILVTVALLVCSCEKGLDGGKGIEGIAHAISHQRVSKLEVGTPAVVWR